MVTGKSRHYPVKKRIGKLLAFTVDSSELQSLIKLERRVTKVSKSSGTGPNQNPYQPCNLFLAALSLYVQEEPGAVPNMNGFICIFGLPENVVLLNLVTWRGIG